MDREREIDKRRIVYLCQRIIAKDIDIILALREIDRLNCSNANVFGEHIIEEWTHFVITFVDQVDRIRYKKAEEETKILKFYEQDIIEFAQETIELLGIINVNQLYNQLTSALDKIDIEECDYLINMIIALEAENCVSKLLEYFTDNSNAEKTEILILIAKKIEHYPTEILKNLSSMLSRAKDWAYYLLFNILKNPQTFSIFLQNKHLIEDQDLLMLLQMISKNDAKHVPNIDIINELIEKLKS